jgi:hypothetical protein
MCFCDAQSVGGLQEASNAVGAARMAGLRRAQCEDAACGSADGAGMAHQAFASIFKRQRCSESAWSSMSSWNKRQEMILKALTPHQSSTNETQQGRKSEQDGQNSNFFTSIQRQDEADTFSLSFDDPRMRYAGVSSLVALFNYDARTDSLSEDIDSRDDNDLSSLLKYTHVTGGL